MLQPDVDEIEDMLITAESREVAEFLRQPVKVIIPRPAYLQEKA